MNLSEYSKKHRILIVDDSDLNCSVLTDMLIDAFDIDEAHNGLEAIEYLEKNREYISLILLNLMMPVMNGIEVLDIMNKKGWINDVPVIIISSDQRQDAVKETFDLGASDYIARPFDAYIVYKRIMNIISIFNSKKIRAELAHYKDKKVDFFWNNIKDLCFEYQVMSDSLNVSKAGERFLMRDAIIGIGDSSGVYDESAKIMLKSALQNILNIITVDNPNFNFNIVFRGENYGIIGESIWDGKIEPSVMSIYGILRKI